MNLHDKISEDVTNYVKELLEINHIKSIDSKLVDIIFNTYVFELTTAYIRKALYLFCMFCLAVIVLVYDCPLPMWVRIIFAYTIVRYATRIGINNISNEALDHFTQKTIPDIFETHKSMWKLDESRKDDE